jgi:hypothetical protein
MLLRRALIAVVLPVAAALAAAAPQPRNLSGSWSFAVVTENGTGTPTVTLAQTGTQLAGTYESSRMGARTLSGSVKGDSVTFLLGGGQVPLTFLGVIESDSTLKGTVDFAGQGGATFTAKRIAK